MTTTYKLKEYARRFNTIPNGSFPGGTISEWLGNIPDILFYFAYDEYSLGGATDTLNEAVKYLMDIEGFTKDEAQMGIINFFWPDTYQFNMRTKVASIPNFMLVCGNELVPVSFSIRNNDYQDPLTSATPIGNLEMVAYSGEAHGDDDWLYFSDFTVAVGEALPGQDINTFGDIKQLGVQAMFDVLSNLLEDGPTDYDVYPLAHANCGSDAFPFTTLGSGSLRFSDVVLFMENESQDRIVAIRFHSPEILEINPDVGFAGQIDILSLEAYYPLLKTDGRNTGMFSSICDFELDESQTRALDPDISGLTLEQAYNFRESDGTYPLRKYIRATSNSVGLEATRRNNIRTF